MANLNKNFLFMTDPGSNLTRGVALLLCWEDHLVKIMVIKKINMICLILPLRRNQCTPVQTERAGSCS